MFDYKNNFNEIQQFAKSIWEKIRLYFIKIEPQKPPFFCLSMFPYPSGAGLHIGHPLGYVGGDVASRFLRMNGYNVLYPFGYDAFGLPAEQFAIQTGQHPEVTTRQNIENMKRQIDELGFCFDKDREINTSDKDYYKWTQWIFLKMYNSFFDHTDIWKTSFGNTNGRAKDISILRRYLEEGSWYIDEAGNPTENIHKLKTNYTNDEINKAIDKARIAYIGYQEVNWCPKLGTVLANEEVKDGKSERGNYPVEKKSMKQWILRISKYSDRLLNFDGLDWPEETIKMQQNWIGKSSGMKISFIDEDKNKIEVFTTRPDTLSGVTFIAVSENHPIYGQKLPKSEVTEQSEFSYDQGEKQKIGIFTGKYAYHVFANKEFDSKIEFLRKIPIWVTNYVASDYGSGAVMGVPAHDERDFEFAKKHNLEIKYAIKPDLEWIKDNLELEKYPDLNDSEFIKKLNESLAKGPFCKKAPLFFSKELGVNEDISLNNLIQYFEKNKIGKGANSYRLRDWIFSRQRYWGEPFPIVYSEDGTAYPIDENELPIELPKQMDFSPQMDLEDPITPLSRSEDWVNVKGSIINGKFTSRKGGDQFFRRETNTMPNWAGSNWYYLRYLDPHNNEKIFSDEAKNYWCGGTAQSELTEFTSLAETEEKQGTTQRDGSKFATVDLYIGGSEHAVLHCLYARFCHMVLFDLDIVPNPEPFLKLVHQGLITADAYVDKDGNYIDPKEVDVKKINDSNVALNKNTQEVLSIEKGKMGKSYKNGVNPLEIIKNHGADVLRLHLMYMAPLTQSRPWNPNLVGMERFCQNVSSMVLSCIEENKKQEKEVKVNLHKTIKAVTENYKSMHYNKCISLMIEFYNSFGNKVCIDDCLAFLKLLHPIAPHLSEYLYQKIKEKVSTLRDSILQPIAPHLSDDILEQIKAMLGNLKESTVTEGRTRFCGVSSVESILDEPWPSWDEKLISSDLVKLTISLNGKLRKVLDVNKEITDLELKEISKNILNIAEDKIMIIRLESRIVVNGVTEG